MTVWQIDSVSVEPVTELTDWSIHKVTYDDEKEKKEETFHFVGLSPGLVGRVSSAIQGFSPTALEGKTKSGRIYKLLGQSRNPISDAAYTWAYWKDANKVVTDTDVSGEPSWAGML